MKVYMRISMLLLTALLLTLPNKQMKADEGMWLPIYLKMISGDMSGLGAKITADDIYNINKSSIKDAIVSMGGYCTGEIVSGKGLIFTNHHCGFDAIAELSSTDFNVLDKGFWAKDFKEEMPVPGLTMSILAYMKDVTALVNDSEDPDAVIDSLITEASKDGKHDADVASMYYGTEHYLMVYDVYRDIRFVGAPPSSIGKFGGDTDNWMWPRHTGDFSVFRIYTDTDNQPADYDENNVPYKPKHFLPISLKGYDESSFACIMGFPGSTDRYLTSASTEQVTQDTYPDYIKIIGERLKIMKTAMDADEQVRLDLASDYASLANSYKYFKGVVERSKISDFIDQKRKYEEKFQKWTGKDETRTEEYGEAIEGVSKLVDGNKELNQLVNYLNFAGFGPSMVEYGIGFYMLNRAFSGNPDMEAHKDQLGSLKDDAEAHFADYNREVDQALLASMARLMYNDLPESNQPSFFKSDMFSKLKDKPKADRFDNMAVKIFKKSLLTNQKKSDKFFKKPSVKALEADPGYQYMTSQLNLYISNSMMVNALNSQEESMMSKYITGIRELNKERNFYPDANSTLRFTYGTVKTYPADNGKMYDYYTTAQQILDKYVPNDEEFDVPEKLRTLLEKKDYGQYAENGVLKVNFLTNTDITGGNSGSPVMDANGHLIGLAFDGNWESMLSDLYFDDTVTRTINVDIRYVLFVIDKYANAQRIIDELTIVK